MDAIVNAANTTLLGGGGVDGAIHQAAGPELLQECRGIGGCPTGEARLTAGYRLPANHVIHTVGPIYGGGGEAEAELLRSAYLSCLGVARENEFRHIAFPSISTGVYRYPVQAAASIALTTVVEWQHRFEIPEQVTFVLFSGPDLAVYQDALDQIRRS